MEQNKVKMVSDAYINLMNQYFVGNLALDDDDLRSDLDPNQVDERSRSDQDLDHDHDLERWFKLFSKSHGLVVDDVDLSGIKRNISWLKDHSSDIKYPKAYIQKMISGCGPKKVPDKVPVGFQPTPKAEDKPITEIYGYSIKEIDELRPYLDQSTWQRILQALPDISKFMFRPYQAVIESQYKSRIMIAEGLKRGLL